VKPEISASIWADYKQYFELDIALQRCFQFVKVGELDDARACLMLRVKIIDDVFTTHGSANINTRSMQVDSELNIAHEWASVTQEMRRQLWDLHTDKKGAQDDAGHAFDAWQDIIDINKDRKKNKKTGVPYAPLVEFYYDKDTMQDLD
jgi:hypothetical protein